MYFFYLLWIFSTGYAWSSLVSRSNGPWGQLALMPWMGLFIPALLIYLLNLLHVPLTSLSLWGTWLPIGLLGVLLFLRKRPHFGRLHWTQILLILALMGLMTRVGISSIWPGDGMYHWSYKALDWRFNHALVLSPELTKELMTWNDYPYFHSICMLVNLLAIPIMPSAFSIHLADGMEMAGVILTALWLVSLFERLCLTLFPDQKLFEKKLFWLGALALGFSQRGLLEMVNSGYADIDIAYLLLLGFALMMDWQRTRPLVLGAVLGTCAITKAEGIYRVVIMVLLCLPFLKIPIRRILPAIIPIFFLKKLDSFSHPYLTHYSQYTSELILVPARILAKVPIVTKALTFAYFNTYQGLFKAGTPLILLLALLCLLDVFLIKRDLYRPLHHFFGLLLMIFVMETLFNLMPTLLVINKVDPRLDNPLDLANLTLMRLHLQSALFLSGIVIFKTLFDRSRN